MLRSIERYLTLHAQNLVGAAGRLARQPFATIMTVVVIAIALALPAGLRILINNVEGLSSSWQGASDFSVYLKLDTTASQAGDLRNQVAARKDVASVQLIDRAQALAEFQAQSGLGQALAVLDDNPLPYTLVVHPTSGAHGDLKTLAGAIGALPHVDLVQLDTAWIARLRAILALAGRALDVVTLLLGIAVILVIGNTIRLEINGRGTEIEVTKLVGGSDGFIRRPFLYTGFWYGLAGAVVANALLAGTLLALESPTQRLAALYHSDFTIAGLSFEQSGLTLIGGALLGWAGAWLATARHLRDIEPK